MFSNRNRDQPKDSISPRGEVGEIDTRAPFQSVRAAVSLFGEVAVNKDRRSSVKRRSSENVLEKETQLLLAQRELNKIKKQLESSETTKAKALSELDKAKVTLQDLTMKLTNVRNSKQSAMIAAEAVKDKAKQLEKALSQKAIGFEAWKQELEHARKEYLTTVTELDASKQELTKIRQDFDAALEAKLAAFQAAGEAQRSAKLNSERINELSKEIATMKSSMEQLKLASLQAQQEQAKIMGEREAQQSYYKTAKEESEKKLASLRNEYEKEYDPELAQTLEAKLAETNTEIKDTQEQMKKAYDSEMDSVRVITSELKEATKTMEDIVAEESSLKNLVASLKTELEQVKKEQEELKVKEQASESLAANLNGELQDSKGDAGAEAGSEVNKDADAREELHLKIQELSSETLNARREAEEMTTKAQELRQEAEKSRALAEEVEKTLELVLKQAEEAKAAQQRAIEEMKILSEMEGRVKNSDPNGRIVLTIEEFEALSSKVKECEDLVERTEAAAMAEVEAINMRRNEVDRKVEANLQAIEEIKAATDMALKNAEMADSAKIAVEGELRRWRQEDQNGVSNLDLSDSSPRPISLLN